MRSYIDENDKINEIRLLLRHPSYKNKTIIIVEGETDIRLFRKILNHEKLEIESVDGKKRLIEVMKKLLPDFKSSILGICDADHDHLFQLLDERSRYSIYITDQHDAEVMLLNSPALDSFINEFTTKEHASTIGAKILPAVFDSAYTIGLIRWINADEHLNINFKGLNFSLFTSTEGISVTIDAEKLISELIIRSKNKLENCTKEYLNQKIEEYNKKQGCKFQVCCGHDLTNILSMIYRQPSISIDTNMDAKKIESTLRVGYNKHYFISTLLFQNMNRHLVANKINIID